MLVSPSESADTVFVFFLLPLWFRCYTHLSSSDLWSDAGSVLSARKHNDQLYHYKLYNIIVIQRRQLSDFKAGSPGDSKSFQADSFQSQGMFIC